VTETQSALQTKNHDESSLAFDLACKSRLGSQTKEGPLPEGAKNFQIG